jgi:hypothetical protein
VIDSAGSIYVLGDRSGSTDNIDYNDVWRSADKGEAPHLCATPVLRVLGGYSTGYSTGCSWRMLVVYSGVLASWMWSR